MVQVLRGTKAANEAVAVTTIVAGALHLPQMGHLVENSGSLILSMASAAKGRKTSEEEGAVDHLASGWGRVG